MPAAVRVVVFETGILLHYFSLGAGAGHGRAQEAVDDHHDEEEQAERDAEVEQPLGVIAVTVSQRLQAWKTGRNEVQNTDPAAKLALQFSLIVSYAFYLKITLRHCGMKGHEKEHGCNDSPITSSNRYVHDNS